MAMSNLVSPTRRYINILQASLTSAEERKLADIQKHY